MIVFIFMREVFVKSTEKYIGTKFRYMSHNPKYGIDCFGLLSCAFYDIGINNIFVDNLKKSDLYRIRDSENLYKIFNQNLFSISTKNVFSIGDILIIKTNFHLPHICIITDKIDNNMYITHADSSIGYVVKNILDDKYSSTIIDVINLSLIYSV